MVHSINHRLLPGDVARDVVADPATREAVTAFAELMGALHRTRVQQRPSHTGMLVQLAKRGPLRSTELAATMHLDASTISRHLAGLEQQGLIVRETDPADRRAQRIALTPAGLAEARAAIAVIVRRNELVFAEWSEADRRTFARLLNDFVSRFEAVHNEGTQA